MHSSTGTTLYHPAHMYMIDHDCTCTFVTVDRNISKLVKSPEHDWTRTASYGSSSWQRKTSDLAEVPQSMPVRTPTGGCGLWDCSRLGSLKLWKQVWEHMSSKPHFLRLSRMHPAGLFVTSLLRFHSLPLATVWKFEELTFVMKLLSWCLCFWYVGERISMLSSFWVKGLQVGLVTCSCILNILKYIAIDKKHCTMMYHRLCARGQRHFKQVSFSCSTSLLVYAPKHHFMVPVFLSWSF